MILFTSRTGLRSPLLGLVLVVHFELGFTLTALMVRLNENLTEQRVLHFRFGKLN